MSLPIHPISAASPDLPDAQMSKLTESILLLGQLVPVVIYRGEILDGRKRMAACQLLGVEPKTVTIPDDADPGEHGIALNLLRTHYTPNQRAIYAAEIANLAHGTNRFQEKTLRNSKENVDLSNDSSTPGRPRPPTIAEAAAALQISETSVYQARSCGSA